MYLATPPRARNRAESTHHATFMMASLKGKNRRGAKGLRFNLISNEEVPSMNVFGTRVVLWIVGQVYGRLVVECQRRGLAEGLAELI
eukprot:3654045-Pleurochrysis_carterae.AAC.1